MKPDDQPGLIPVSALHGRKSASADRARLEQIRKDLRLTPRERLERAISLGQRRAK